MLDAACHDLPAPPGAGWTWQVLAETGSTNSYASKLPAWCAVRAVVQTAGRGRTPDRKWLSDEGGLWLSAVLPCPGARPRWSILPLAVGWAMLEVVRSLGVADVRLRWPNDIMIGPRKLAGLLVERFSPDTAVVGIGLNVYNELDLAAPGIACEAIRLVELMAEPPTIDELADRVLRQLRRVHAIIVADGFPAIAEDLNRQWRSPRRVRLTLNTANAGAMEGFFRGVDADGRLQLETTGGNLNFYDATQVALLRELE